MKIHFSEDCRHGMEEINGYYFTTKYPGEESQKLTEEDILRCFEVVEMCRNDINKIIAELEIQKKEKEKKNESVARRLSANKNIDENEVILNGRNYIPDLPPDEKFDIEHKEKEISKEPNSAEVRELDSQEEDIGDLL